MKKINKFIGLILAMVMAMSLCVSMSVSTSAATGTIKVTNASVGETYTLYKMLDLSVNTAENAFTYTVTADWESFFNAQTTYVTVDSNGVVTWNTDEKDDTKKAFAALALAYAKDSNNNISATSSAIATSTDPDATTTTLEFKDLEYGYYLLESSIGTVLSLDSLSSSVEINDKNSSTNVNKVVYEDSAQAYQAENSAEVGQTVYYRSGITDASGAVNLVLHDTMDAGLTLDADSIKVYIVNKTGYADTVELIKNVTLANNYVAETEDPTTTFDIITSPTDGCTFEIEFVDTYTASLGSSDIIVITYEAVVNENAVIYNGTNENETYVKFGNGSTSTKKTTDTNVYEFYVYKYTGDISSSHSALAGAKFQLYKTESNVNYYAQINSNGKITGWTKSADDTSTIVESPSNGLINIAGLDTGDTYYLIETEAPAGYNKDTTVYEIKIDASGVVNGTFSLANLSLGSSTTTNVKAIVNSSGTEMPATGGMGTKIFYTLGGFLVLCAGVLLITKRRMGRV